MSEEAKPSAAAGSSRPSEGLQKLGTLAVAVVHDVNDELTMILNHVEICLELLGPQHPARADLQDAQCAAMHCAEITRGLLAFSIGSASR